MKVKKDKKKKQWWGPAHDKAFHDYYFNVDISAEEKEHIFNNILFPAYEILARNIVANNQWHIPLRITADDLMVNLIVFAHRTAPKYNADKNTPPSSFLYLCMQRDCYNKWRNANKRMSKMMQEQSFNDESENAMDPTDLKSYQDFMENPDNRPEHYSAVDDIEFQVEWKKWLRQWGGRVFEGRTTELKMLNYMLDLDFSGVEVGRHRGGIYNMLAEKFKVSSPTLRLFISRMRLVSKDLYGYYYQNNKMPSPHQIQRPTKLRLLQENEERAKKKLIARNKIR